MPCGRLPKPGLGQGLGSPRTTFLSNVLRATSRSRGSRAGVGHFSKIILVRYTLLSNARFKSDR